MKKTLISFAVLSMTTIANAVPNIWKDYFIKGYDIYSISSLDNKTLRIMCNSASTTSFIHLIELDDDLDKKTYPHTNLSFLINDTDQITPTVDTVTYTDSENWHNLTNAFSNATKIDVYLNNKLVTTITPENPQTLFDLKSCLSMYERKLKEQSEEEGKEYIPSQPLS